MKRFLTIILPLLLFAGCATTPTNTNPMLDNMLAVAETATYTGTSLYLVNHQDKRPIFIAAQNALTALASTNAPTPLDLLNIIKTLPIDELKLESAEGRIAVGAAILLYRKVSGTILPVDKPELVTKTAAAIAEGIQLALATTDTAVKATKR